MQSINALSLAPDGNDWLANSRHPHILHVFDQVCNLINERREVLSVVTPKIGDGPFNLVIEDDVLFSRHLNIDSLISIVGNQLTLGDLTINVSKAELWSPVPDWETLHSIADKILNPLRSISISNYQQPLLPASLLTDLSWAIASADLPASIISTRKLAGLGCGLTPAGDDFILGAIHAAWIIHPTEVAGVLAEGIANAAAPLTTSLSAAWLKSAGRGEAGILWHNFFNALIDADSTLIQESMDKILCVGETSGTDALSGFLNVSTSLKEKE